MKPKIIEVVPVALQNGCPLNWPLPGFLHNHNNIAWLQPLVSITKRQGVGPF